MDPRNLIDLSYCPQTIDKGLGDMVLNALKKLNANDETKPVFSLNWVLRRISKIEVIVLPPTVTLSEDIPLRVRRNLSRGSHLLFSRCAENNIPIVYALSKPILSNLLRGSKERTEKDWHDLYPVGLTSAGIKAAGLENEIKEVIEKAKALAKDWENGWEEEYEMQCISCQNTFDRVDLCCGCLIDESHVYCSDCIIPNNWAKGCPTCISRRSRQYDDEDEENEERPRSKKPRDRPERKSRKKGGVAAKRELNDDDDEDDEDEDYEEEDQTYKWKICRVWLRLGKCPYGPYCQYKHGEEDTREFPEEKPEDWNAPPIDYVKSVHPVCKAVFSAMLKEFHENRGKEEAEADDEAEEVEDVPEDVLLFRDCHITFSGDNQLTISGRSLKWTEIAYFKLRDEFIKRIQPDSAAPGASKVNVVVTGDEPFRFTGRKKNRLLRLKGHPGRRDAAPEESAFKSKAGGFTFASSAYSAEEGIGDLLNAGGKNNFGELRLGLGFTRFALEHENVVQEEEESEDGEEKKVRTRVKEWSQEDLAAWKTGTDFNLRFNSYWLPAQAEYLKTILRSRGFAVQEPADLLEIKCLSGKEWKSFWFKWNPKEDEEAEEVEESEDAEEGKRKERKPLRGDWTATDPLGEIAPATQNDQLVYYLNLSSNVDKDAVFIVSPTREADKSPVEEALTGLLNPKDEATKPTPISLNSRILDQSSVFIKDYRVIRKQRLASPDGQYAVEFQTVKRKGVAVNFVWNKPLGKLEKGSILNVLRLSREWLYQAKSMGAIDDLRQKNRTLVAQVKELEKNSNSKGRGGGKRSSKKRRK